MYSTPTTVPISFVRKLLEGPRLDPAARAGIVVQAGIAPALLETDAGRVTTEQFASLYRLLARALDDELPGLFSRPVRAGAFKFLCLSLIESASLQTALFRFTRFFHLLLDDLSIELTRPGELVRMSLVPRIPSAADNVFAQEIMLKLIHGVASWLTGYKLPLLQVDCSYPRPAHADEYALLYPGPVQFERPVTALSFAASQLAAPVRQNRSSLGAFLSRAPGDWLFVSFSERVQRQRVVDFLEPRLGSAGKVEDAAEALHCSVRTLTRRLAAEGTSFQEIKDELRRDRAIQRLTESSLPIAVIGGELGFEAPTAFHRAFRKWTGSTPRAYRVSR